MEASFSPDSQFIYCGKYSSSSVTYRHLSRLDPVVHLFRIDGRKDTRVECRNGNEDVPTERRSHGASTMHTVQSQVHDARQRLHQHGVLAAERRRQYVTADRTTTIRSSGRDTMCAYNGSCKSCNHPIHLPRGKEFSSKNNVNAS